MIGERGGRAGAHVCAWLIERLKTLSSEATDVPARVERTDPDGVDYGRVMQLTFIVTIAAGAPLVAILSLGADLPTWGDRATFAVRVCAPVWLVTSVAMYLYERRRVAD